MVDAASRLLEWMAALGLSGVDLVGTSHGGGVAMAAAILDRQRAGKRVGRLALVAPAHPYMRVGRFRVWLLNSPLAPWLTKVILQKSLIGPGLDRMYHDPAKITQQTREGYAAAIEAEGTAGYALGVMKTWRDDMRWLRDNMSDLRDTPALLLWGKQDAVVPAASARLLHENLPGSRVVMLQGAGHLPYEESPEEFDRLLLAFLDAPGNNAVNSE
jgi:pimeloyl-ACP methyl ester carboxylesterase